MEGMTAEDAERWCSDPMWRARVEKAYEEGGRSGTGVAPLRVLVEAGLSPLERRTGDIGNLQDKVSYLRCASAVPGTYLRLLWRRWCYCVQGPKRRKISPP